MSYDAKIDSAQMSRDLTGIANAIRAKTGSNSSLLFPSGFVSAVQNINHGALDWMGDEVEFVSEFHRSKTMLSATDFATWTPSKTATDMQASSNLSTISINLADYEYMIEWLWQFTPAYPSGQTYKNTIDRQVGAIYQTAHRRPYGLANFEAENYAYNYVTALTTNIGYLIYWTSKAARSWTTGNSYGVYCSSTTATVSSTGADTVNLTPKTPKIVARCNDTYFTTTRADEIDKANSHIIIVGNLYRMRVGSCALRNMYGKTIDIYNHPLTVT
jgi:hypothetical protein